VTRVVFAAVSRVARLVAVLLFVSVAVLVIVASRWSVRPIRRR